MASLSPPFLPLPISVFLPFPLSLLPIVVTACRHNNSPAIVSGLHHNPLPLSLFLSPLCLSLSSSFEFLIFFFIIKICWFFFLFWKLFEFLLVGGSSSSVAAAASSSSSSSSSSFFCRILVFIRRRWTGEKFGGESGA